MCTCVFSVHVCAIFHVLVVNGPVLRGLEDSEGEKPHTFTQAIQSVCLSNTAPNGHLRVCPNKMSK